MGFFLNPTQDQLSEWYKCNERIAQHFMNHFPVIYIDKSKNYYFVKTDKFKKAYSERPFSIKLLELFR